MNLKDPQQSVNPLFSLLESSSAHMEIEIAGTYWPQANIGKFSFVFFFLVTYLRFSEVEFLKFYYQDKKKLKKVSLKILYKKKRPQVPLRSSNESMDKHSFQGSSKFTKRAFLYHLTYSFVPWWLLCYDLKTRDFPWTGSFKLRKFILDFDAKGKITK